MNLLLDSCAFLWFIKDAPQLSAKAKQFIEDANNHKHLSVASCWEMAIKAGLGKLGLGEPAESFISREVAANNFDLLSISVAHACAVETLPLHHRDPFDRLLVVQAKLDNMSIVSNDLQFDAYGVPRIW